MNAPNTKTQPRIAHDAKVAWRPVLESDMDGILSVADSVHPTLPEAPKVFKERRRLFPEGCFVLADGKNSINGYAISHPIRRNQPPELDVLLGGIAPDADWYYIHDVAILPEFRGRGLAARVVSEIFKVAEGFDGTCLVAVYGSGAFWARFGFLPVPVEGPLELKTQGYGDDAEYLCRQNPAL